MNKKSKNEEAVKELARFEQYLDRILFEKNQNYMVLYRDFLLNAKRKELGIDAQEGYGVAGLVYDTENTVITMAPLIIEWEMYKLIPKTRLKYRYDKGKGLPGSQDHIHVYVGNNKNELYAINKDGTTHDGSRATLGRWEIEFLKKMGFSVPKDGVLEWISLDHNKNYEVLDFWALLL